MKESLLKLVLSSAGRNTVYTKDSGWLSKDSTMVDVLLWNVFLEIHIKG